MVARWRGTRGGSKEPLPRIDRRTRSEYEQEVRRVSAAYIEEHPPVLPKVERGVIGGVKLEIRRSPGKNPSDSRPPQYKAPDKGKGKKAADQKQQIEETADAVLEADRARILGEYQRVMAGWVKDIKVNEGGKIPEGHLRRVIADQAKLQSELLALTKAADTAENNRSETEEIDKHVASPDRSGAGHHDDEPRRGIYRSVHPRWGQNYIGGNRTRSDDDEAKRQEAIQNAIDYKTSQSLNGYIGKALQTYNKDLQEHTDLPYTGMEMPDTSISFDDALEIVARTLDRPIKTVRRQLGLDEAGSATTRRTKATPRGNAPKSAGQQMEWPSEKWLASQEHGSRKQGAFFAFARRVWKPFIAETGAVVTRRMLAEIDPPAAAALKSALRGGPIPEDIGIIATKELKNTAARGPKVFHHGLR